MSLDKTLSDQLKSFAQTFKTARSQADKPADIAVLIKFFEDVLGYDSAAGEIAEKVVVHDKYCDFAAVIDGAIKLFVATGAKGGLQEKDIAQAESCAAYSGINWVILTNGCDWRAYHIRSKEGGEIVHDLAFETALEDAEKAWTYLKLLSKDAMHKRELDAFWTHKKSLSPSTLVRVLLSDPVLSVLQQELNQHADLRLEKADVFSAVRGVIRKDALDATPPQPMNSL